MRPDFRQIDPVRHGAAGGPGTHRPRGDTGARRPLRGYRQGAQGPGRRHQDRHHRTRDHLPVASGGEGAFAGLSRRQLFQRALRQGGPPQAEAGILPAGRQRGRHRLHHPEARRADRFHPLHQPDGAAARRQRQDALPPAQHGMHAHQDRGGDRDHTRQGRVARPLRAVSSAIRQQDRLHSSDIRARRSPFRLTNRCDASQSRLRIHKAFVSSSSHSAATKPRTVR